MKICIVVPDFPPHCIGGTQTSSYELAKSLSKTRNEIHVITKMEAGTKKIEFVDGFYLHRVKRPDFPPKIRFIVTIMNFLKEIKKLKPDIILAKMISPSGVSAAIAKKIYKIPFIVQAEGIDIIGNKNFLEKRINKFVIDHTNSVISATFHMKKIIEKEYRKNNVNIIENGIDLERVKNIPKLKKQKNKIILFVGRIEKTKGLDILIESFTEVSSKNNNLQLLILGDGYLKDELEKKYNKKNIFFKGFVSPDKVISYMKSSHVFVMPSIIEGQGMSLIEAMACGVPIIATNTGGIPELIKKENGILIRPGDNDSLSDAIINILKDEKLREMMIKNNLKKAKKHDWKIISKEYIKIFKSLNKNRN